MKTFEPGKTYSTRSVCDHECIFSFTVVRRTAKSVWLESRGKVTRRSIKSDGSAEYVLPHGSYSMAPVLRAA